MGDFKSPGKAVKVDNVCYIPLEEESVEPEENSENTKLTGNLPKVIPLTILTQQPEKDPDVSQEADVSEKAEVTQETVVSQEADVSKEPDESKKPDVSKEPAVPKKDALPKKKKTIKLSVNSLLGAKFICLSGGMNLAWSFGFKRYFDYLSFGELLHLQICWFVAVIFGSCISAIFIKKISMRIFNILASILVMINGILFTMGPDNAIFAAVGRYCDGIAFGLIVIPTIITAAERSKVTCRGALLSFEQWGLTLGSIFYLCYSNYNNSSLIGVFSLICGAVALGLTFFYTVESTVFYLRKDNEEEAIHSLYFDQKPSTTLSNEVLLKESKCLLEEDTERGLVVNFSKGLLPMVKLLLFRILTMMSYSLPFTFAWGVTDNGDTFGMLYGLALMRLIGVVFASYTLDNQGRKRLTGYYLFLGGGVLFIVGVNATNNASEWMDYINRSDNLTNVFLFAYQIFVGFAAPASTCYLGEAFSISVKQYFILFIFIFENVIQIIFFCLFTSAMLPQSFLQYIYVLGAIQIMYAIYFLAGMPETKQTTLRQALGKFL